jgi:GNAT superfamily N-acetyltransferase
MGSKSGGRTSGGRRSRVGGGASPAEEALGVSSAPPIDAPKNVSVTGYDNQVRNQFRQIFSGREISQEEAVKLSGALDGSQVFMTTGYGGSVNIQWRSVEGRSSVTISKSADGNVKVYNDIFKIHEDYRGQGHALTAFGREIDQAAKLGVKRLDLEAARATGVFNGYYTWPRLGYDAKLTTRYTRALREDVAATAAMQQATKVSDLMKTSEGRAWWLRNGDSTHMAFDLTPGSLSRRVFDGYRAESQRRSR